MTPPRSLRSLPTEGASRFKMKAYLINLDRSPERRAFFEAQAHRAALALHRISAVDGRQLSEDDAAAATAKSYRFQPINPAELGLFLSHRLAWKALVDSGEAYAAVFEDDAVLSTQASAVLDAIAQRAPLADVIKLETTRRHVVLGSAQTPLTPGHVLAPLCSWHGGTAAYVVSRQGAQHLLAATWPIADPVDQVMFNPLSPVWPKLQILQVLPGVCIQKNILERELRHDPVFGTTIGRNRQAFRGFRHGLWVDARRAWLKQRERWRRWRLAGKPGFAWIAVSFDGPPV